MIAPELQFERNAMFKQGRYLMDLSKALQRLVPHLQECGDLLERESLITDAEQRKSISEKSVLIGEALEKVSKASGSVAHLYKSVQVEKQGRYKKFDVDKDLQHLVGLYKMDKEEEEEA